MDERTASCFCVERAINFNFLTVDVPFADKTVQIRRPCNMVAFRTEKPGFSRSFEPSFFSIVFYSFPFFFFDREKTQPSSSVKLKIPQRGETKTEKGRAR